MIVFDLCCELQHTFEVWFKNHQDFERQQQKKWLQCPICGSDKVNKQLSASKLQRKSNQQKNADSTDVVERKKYLRTQQALHKLHKYVDENFADVGDQFHDEALKMHSGEKNKANITGTASVEQTRELIEKGVDIAPLPLKPVDKKRLN